MARADIKEERAEKERPYWTQQGPIESKTLLSVKCIKFPKVSKVTVELTHIHILYNQVKVKTVNEIVDTESTAKQNNLLRVSREIARGITRRMQIRSTRHFKSDYYFKFAPGLANLSSLSFFV